MTNVDGCRWLMLMVADGHRRLFADEYRRRREG